MLYIKSSFNWIIYNLIKIIDGSKTGSLDAFGNSGKFGCTIVRILEGNKRSVVIKINYYRLSRDVVTCDVTFRLHTANLLQAMRSTGHASPYKARCSAVIVSFQQL